MLECKMNKVTVREHRNRTPEICLELVKHFRSFRSYFKTNKTTNNIETVCYNQNLASGNTVGGWKSVPMETECHI